MFAAKPEHFQQCDVPLLAAFVKAAVIADVAGGEIKRLMAETPKSLLDVYARATRTVHLLSMRLRLSPQARQPHLSRASDTRVQPANVYDRMRAERAANGS